MAMPYGSGGPNHSTNSRSVASRSWYTAHLRAGTFEPSRFTGSTDCPAATYARAAASVSAGSALSGRAAPLLLIASAVSITVAIGQSSLLEHTHAGGSWPPAVPFTRPPPAV